MGASRSHRITVRMGPSFLVSLLVSFLFSLSVPISITAAVTTYQSNAYYLGCIAFPYYNFQWSWQYESGVFVWSPTGNSRIYSNVSSNAQVTPAQCIANARASSYAVAIIDPYGNCWSDSTLIANPYYTSYTKYNGLCTSLCLNDPTHYCGSTVYDSTTNSIGLVAYQINYGPVIFQISPQNGATAGSTKITIYGYGFTGTTATGLAAAPTVTFTESLTGATGTCTAVSVTNDTMLTCKTPALFGNPKITMSVNSQQSMELPVWPHAIFSPENSTTLDTWYCLNVYNYNTTVSSNWETVHICTAQVSLGLMLSSTGPISGLTCTSFGTGFIGWENWNLCWNQYLPYEFVFEPNGYNPATQTCLQLSSTGDSHWSNAFLCVPTGEPTQNQGTQSLLYEYKSPAISSITPAFMNTNGTTYITVKGSSFGVPPADTQSQFLINGNECVIVPSTWADTSFQCLSPVGQGGKPSLSLTVVGNSVSYTSSADVSYHPPVITSINPPMYNTTGGVIITLTGEFFGSTNGVVMLILPSLGNTYCPLVSWNDTEIQCNLPAGFGASLSFQIYTLANYSSKSVVQSSQGLKSTTGIPPLFSYLPPVITRTNPVSTPTSSGNSITIYGWNFGTMSAQASSQTQVIMDGTICTSSAALWVDSPTGSHITCTAPDTCLALAPLTVITGGQTSPIWYYPIVAPVLNAPSAPYFYNTADNPPNCSPPKSGVYPGICPPGAILQPEDVNPGGLDFNPPSVTAITIHGSGFCNSSGYSYATQTINSRLQVWVGDTPCNADSQWSNTQITCGVPYNTWGFQVPVWVNRSGLVSQISDVWSFSYQPQLSLVNTSYGTKQYQYPGGKPFLPTAGGYTVTLMVQSGLDNRYTSKYLYNSDPNKNLMNVFVSGYPKALKNVAYVSPDEGPNFGNTGMEFGYTQNYGYLTVAMPPFETQSGADYSCIYVVLGNLTTCNVYCNSYCVYFEYDWPQIYSIYPTNGPTVGEFKMTISGQNFGTLNSHVPVVNFVSHPTFTCPVSFSNDSTIICTVPPGAGEGYEVNVAMGAQQISNNFTFSYFPPNITNAFPLTGSVDGGYNITVVGDNFYGLNANILFNNTVYAVIIHNSTTAIFTAPPGYGKVTFYIVIQFQASNFLTFDYLGPKITRINPTHANTHDQSVLTMYGTNFVTSQISTVVGPNPCVQVSPGMSNSTVQYCRIPIGQGIFQNVSCTVGPFQSNEVGFSYNPPNISSIVWNPSLALTSGAPITLFGYSFGTSGSTVVGPYQCTPSLPLYFGQVVTTGQPYQSIQCTTSPGQGANLPVYVTVSGQTNKVPVYFSFQPPSISSVSPSSGPTLGGQVVTFTGSNFGVSVIMTFNVSHIFRNCTTNGFPQSATSFQCYLPKGEGINNIVTALVGGQLSPKFYYTYLGPSLVTVGPYCANVPNSTYLCGPADGSTYLTMTGTNFGQGDNNQAYLGTSTNLFQYESLTVSTATNETTAVFRVPVGTGINKYVTIVTAGQKSTANSSYIFNYDPPVIYRLSGCVGDKGNYAFLCPVLGGRTMTITGRNFGPTGGVDVIVQIGYGNTTLYPRTYPLPLLVSINNATRTDTNLNFELPAYAPGGYYMNVFVFVDGQSAQAALLSYAGPTFTTGSLHLNETLPGDTTGRRLLQKEENPPGGTPVVYVSTDPVPPQKYTIKSTRSDGSINLLFNSTFGYESPYFSPERRVTLHGTFLGNNVSDVNVTIHNSCAFLGVDCGPLSVSQIPFWYCDVNYVYTDASGNSTLTCSVRSGLGANLVFTVSVGLQTSGESLDTISYPRPVVNTNGTNIQSTTLIGERLKTTSVVGQNQAGDTVEFDVENVGPVEDSAFAALLVIYMVQYTNATSYTITSKTCDITQVPTWGVNIDPYPAYNQYFIRCNTEFGVGSGYHFVVSANLQLSLPGYDQYQYVAPPSVYKVDGAPYSIDIGNATFDVPTVGGITLTLHGDLFAPNGLTVLVGENICQSAFYININTLTCVVAPSTGLNLPVIVDVSSLFSQAVDLLSYHTADVFSISGCQDDIFNGSLVLDTRNCSRFGGNNITLTGDYFGPSVPAPTIIVGGSACTFPQVDNPAQTLSNCVLPPGTLRAQPVLYIQAGGPVTLAESTITYKQCFPGTYAAVGQLDCQGTMPGSFTDSDGLNVPKICPDGTYSLYNATVCTACTPGYYSVAGSSGASRCSACQPGTFTDADSQPTCQLCQSGTYNNATNSTQCYQCNPGYFQPNPAQPSCLPCPAGYFADNFGSQSCTLCGPGHASTGGAKICLACPPGSVAAQSVPSGPNTYCNPCSPGYFAQFAGQLKCEPCNPGSATNMTNQTTCQLCLPGYTTNDGSNSTSCIACNAPQYSPVPGQPHCLDCPEGTFGNQSALSQCFACQVGKHNDRTAQSSCTACTQGLFSAFPGALECEACPVGTFANTSGTIDCPNCLAGTFYPSTGATQCASCPPGTYSLSGAIECSSCPLGTANSKFGQAFCSECSEGSYGGPQLVAQTTVNDPNPSAVPSTITVDYTGNIVCTLCETGKYGAQQGLTTCTPCNGGSYAGPNPGNSNCTECSVGYNQTSSGQSSCSPCGPGLYQDQAGQLLCIECSPGRYNPSYGVGVCQMCGKGNFSDNLGSPTCTPCSPGFVAGSQGQSICDPCQPGFFAPTGGLSNCTGCSIGFYQPNLNETSCIAADYGFVVPGPESPQEAPCPPGTYSPVTNGSICYDCTPRYHQAKSGQSMCLPCDGGTFSTGNGTVSCDSCRPGFFSLGGVTTCSPCTPGSYVNTVGASSCGTCPAGQYAANYSQSACDPCLSGKYSLNASTNCSSCLVGQYSLYQASGCLPCNYGTFNANISQGLCPSCSLGFYGNATGLTVCTACSVGLFANTTGERVCSPCGPGTFTDSNGTTICLNCGPGKFTNESGVTSCTSCSPGSYQPNPGTVQCLLCPPGSYQSGPGNVFCKLCPAGSYANISGQSNCTLCEPGKHQPAQGSAQCDLCDIGSAEPVSGSPAAICPKCIAGYYAPTSGYSSCLYCPAGTYNNYEISSVLSSCISCDAGKISTGAATSCTQCGTIQISEIAPNPGMSFCIPCPSNSQNNTYATACECAIGFAAKPLNATDVNNTVLEACDVCPTGSVCVTTGQIWYTLQAESGWWRTPYIPPTSPEYAACLQSGYCQNDSVSDENHNPLFYRCIQSTYCDGGVNSEFDVYGTEEYNTCAGGRVGPVCDLCPTGTTESVGGLCISCGAQWLNIFKIVLICIGLVIALVAMYVVLIYSNQMLYVAVEDLERHKDLRRRQQQEQTLGMVVEGSTEGDTEGINAVQKLLLQWNDKLDEFFDEEIQNVDAYGGALQRYDHDLKMSGPPSAKPNFMFKLKIVLSFAQIISNMAINLDVQWPDTFSEFTSWLIPTNIDFVKVSGIGCVLPQDNFYNKYILIVCAPPILLVCLGVFYLVPMYLRYATDRIQRKIVRQKYWLLNLYSLFLIYPFVSSTVISTYVCSTYGSTSYLVTDMTQTCNTSTWNDFAILSALMIVVYPFGIPALFFGMLMRYRKRLVEPGVRAEIGFLYDAYTEDRWWFEMADMFHKFFLTCILLVIPPNVALPTGMSAAGVYFVTICCLSPFLRKSDDRLQLFAQTELILLLMAGNNFYSTVTYSAFYDALLTVVLILIVGGFFAFFFLQAYVAFIRWRKDRRMLQKRERAIKQRRMETEAFVGKGEGAVEMVSMPRTVLNRPSIDKGGDGPRSVDKFLAHKEKAGEDSEMMSGVSKGILVNANLQNFPGGQSQV